MNILISILIRIVEVMFVAGVIGSSVVVVLTSVEDFKMLFEKRNHVPREIGTYHKLRGGRCPRLPGRVKLYCFFVRKASLGSCLQNWRSCCDYEISGASLPGQMRASAPTWFVVGRSGSWRR